MNQSDIDAVLEEPRYAPRPRPTPIPSAAWNADPTYCLTVNDSWVSHILGALEVLDQDDTWNGTDDERSAARDQANEIMAALMQKCEDTMATGCCDNIRLRLSITGEVESYNTGFEVWNVDIERDPREFIPLAQTHDLLEDSAEIVRQETAALIVEVLWNMALFGVQKTGSDTIDQYIEEWYTLWLLSVGFQYRQTLADVCLQRIYDTAYRNSEGASNDWFEAFDGDVVDDLRCKVFALLDDEGSLSYANWLTLKSQILDVYGNTLTSLGFYLDNILVLLGSKGLTNMGRRDSIYSQRITDVLVYDATGFDHTTCP